MIYNIGPSFWMKASQQEEDLQAQQSAFYSQLTQLFQQQFASQQKTLGFLQSNLEPLIKNPQGFSPEALTSMRTQASDTIATQFNNAQQNMQNRQFVLGGRQTPNGVMAKQNLVLNEGHAAAESGAQNDITLKNEALKQTNFWNAVSALSGVGGMQNPSYLLSGANQAFGGAFGAANTIAQQNNTLGNIMGGLAGGVLSGLGSASSFLNQSGNGFLNFLGQSL